MRETSSSKERIAAVFILTLALSGCGGGTDAPGARDQASVTVRWIPPTVRNDGTPIALAEIAGYRIRFGANAFELTRERFVPGAGVTSARLSGLPAGRRIFVAIQTVDSAGRSSALSDVASAIAR